MFIFVGAIQSLAIPENQIVNIQAIGSKVEIKFLTGYPTPQELTYTIKHDTEEEAQAEMKSFYNACREGKNAYFFGKITEFINS